MIAKQRLKDLLCDLVDTLLPDDVELTPTPQRPETPGPAQDLYDAVYGPEKKPDPVPTPRPWDDPPFDRTKVPEKLTRLLDSQPEGFCPVCGMRMTGNECIECKL